MEQTAVAVTGERGTGAPSRGVRTDIQGMRAIAVGVVLIYHVLPDRLSGGFVGVDVFFVLSGFLITAHLVNKAPRRPRDFVDFWGRRIRRLLPASLLVLVATLAATRLLGPETLWENTARQSSAAALYVVNWLLAGDAVDYLAADNAPTGVQHYWSLSVEEQFYLVWPLLIGFLVWFAARSRVRTTWVLAGGLGAVVVASLAWSVHLTATDPGRAYFVTPTRVWELAAGALVAVLLVERPLTHTAGVVRAAVGWTGLALIVGASVSFDASTPFPSWTAAIPVGGAALLVAAQCGTQWWSPGRLLALRPMQWLGDISYSVYLWHWPIVVLVGARSGPIGWLDALCIVALSLVLAALTKKYVEDPFRTRSWNRRLGRSYALAVVGMALVLASSSVLQWDTDRRAEAAEQTLARALDSADPCLGAGSLDPDRQCAPASGPVIPAPAAAAKDKSDAYEEVSGAADCWSAEPAYADKVCTFGPRDATRDVVLVGNSHAGHWLPALQQIAERRSWRITTRLASQCALTDVNLQFSTQERSDACREWGSRTVQEIIEADPDLVVVSNRVSLSVLGKNRPDSSAGYTAGYTKVLQRLADADVKVAVLRDTPAPGDGGVIESIPDCLAEAGVRSSSCDGTRADWFDPVQDPVEPAVQAVADPDVRLIDLTDRICDGETCRAVQGGVIVYFDASHLTATYAQTLAPALDRALAPIRPAAGS